MEFALENINQSFKRITCTDEAVRRADFENCTFEKCTFVSSNFEHCRFTDCSFTECVISANKPTNSSFIHIRFKDSKVMGFDWTKSRLAHELSFEECDITYSNFSYLKLHKLLLLNCNAKECDFIGSDLTGSIFTDTNFEGSKFSQTNLTKADFRKAYNYGIDTQYNILKKALFSLPEASSLLLSLDIILE